MRSVELLVIGVMLIVVALVPPGWQDRRWAWLLRGRTTAPIAQLRPRRRPRVLTTVFAIAGGAFVLLGIHAML